MRKLSKLADAFLFVVTTPAFFWICMWMYFLDSRSLIALEAALADNFRKYRNEY